MKVKDLIELLLDADPEGEAEVCVDNIDIIGIDGPKPTYYDGHFVKINCLSEARCEKKGVYNTYGVVKVTAKTKGQKITLLTMSPKKLLLITQKQILNMSITTKKTKHIGNQKLNHGGKKGKKKIKKSPMLWRSFLILKKEDEKAGEINCV